MIGFDPILIFLVSFIAGCLLAPKSKIDLTKRDLCWLGWKPTHLHYKGGFYEEATRAISAGPITEGETVVVYVANDGRVYVRAVREFDQPDRFKEMPDGEQ